MSRRTREEIDRARADVLAVLEEAGPLPEWLLIARVLGYQTVDALQQAWPGRLIDNTLRDLSYLRRHGHVTDEWDRLRYSHVWRLATLDDVDAEEDQREVARLMAAWEEVPT